MSLQTFNFIQEDLKALFTQVKPQDLELLKGSHVAITGGTGHVGTWICEVIHFLNENFDFNTRVFVLDRDIEKAKNGVPHLVNSNKFDFQRTDIRYLVELPKSINYVIHAAGLPDSRDHVSNPVEVMSGIALGTEAILKASERLSNLKMFLHMSSSLVYGSFSDRKEDIKETDFTSGSDVSVSSVYAEAKRYSEALVSSYRQQYRLPVTIVRPFSLVGPYQPLSGPWAVNNFINDAMEGRTIKVLGDGETLRSFIYGSDMAFWILRTLVSAESGTKFNLGSPESISIKDLSSIVLDHFNIKKEVVYYAGTGAVHKKNRMVPDTSLIQKTFQLKVTVPLKKAIERSVQWYQLARK